MLDNFLNPFPQNFLLNIFETEISSTLSAHIFCFKFASFTLTRVLGLVVVVVGSGGGVAGAAAAAAGGNFEAKSHYVAEAGFELNGCLCPASICNLVSCIKVIKSNK